jgi:hypothetical protein
MKTTSTVLQPGQRIRFLNSQWKGEVATVGDRWGKLPTYNALRKNGQKMVITYDLEFEFVQPTDPDYA